MNTIIVLRFLIDVIVIDTSYIYWAQSRPWMTSIYHQTQLSA